MSFLLQKWYLDCTAADGTTVIVHAARLAWGLLRLPYVAALVVRPGGRVEALRRFSRRTRVERDGPAFRLRAPAIGLLGSWVPAVPEIEVELLARSSTSIRWRCSQPGTTARVTLPGGETLTGLGYGEELRMSHPPWSLPFRELRWGRFLGGGRSLIWIDWKDGLEERWVFLDGKPLAACSIDPAGLAWPGGRLVLERGELVREETIGTIAGRSLAWLLPRRLSRAVECRRLSRASLEEAGQGAVEGWSVHEVVRWA
jgi:hypothetical protein